MMVNMNGLSYGTWRNIQKAIEQFDSPVKSSGNYLLKLQEVFTPGHTRQIHVLPKLGEGSLGDAAEYQRVSDKYCWEIIVADDTRFGRHVSVCSYFTEPAFEVFADTLGWNEQHREQYRLSTDIEKEKKIQEQFALKVLETIWGEYGHTIKKNTIMRRCRKCYCTNPAACQACRSYYRGRVKNALIIAFVMCVGAMLLGCILALLMIGVFLLL